MLIHTCWGPDPQGWLSTKTKPQTLPLKHGDRGWWHRGAVRGKKIHQTCWYRSNTTDPLSCCPKSVSYAPKSPICPDRKQKAQARMQAEAAPDPHVPHQAGSCADLGFTQRQATGIVRFYKNLQLCNFDNVPSPGAFNIKIKYWIPYVHLISFNMHPAQLSKNRKETQSKTIRSGFFSIKKRQLDYTDSCSSICIRWDCIFLRKKPRSPKGFQIAPVEADNCILLCAFPNNNSVKEKGFLFRVTYLLIPCNVLLSQSTLSTLCLRPMRSPREKKIHRVGDDPHERILINSSVMLHKVILLN